MHVQNRNRIANIENKLVVTKGKREAEEGQIRGMELTDTNYYI